MNTSEGVHFTTDESVEDATQASTLFQKPPDFPIVSLIIGLCTGVTGMCVNVLVLVVLLFARRHFGSSITTYITNQSVMDLFACVFLIISNSMWLPGAPKNYPWLGDIGKNLVCFPFRDKTLAVVCVHAEKIGLTVKSASPWYNDECNVMGVDFRQF